MTMNKYISTAAPVLITSILFIFMVFSPFTALANEAVVGRYLQNSGTTIHLQLTIRNPAPQNLILQQQLPPGTQVITTSPKAKKISPRDGSVKWLFKGVSAGKIDVVMQVQPPVPPGAASGSIRYRMKDGAMHVGRVGR